MKTPRNQHLRYKCLCGINAAMKVDRIFFLAFMTFVVKWKGQCIGTQFIQYQSCKQSNVLPLKIELFYIIRGGTFCRWKLQLFNGTVHFNSTIVNCSFALKKNMGNSTMKFCRDICFANLNPSKWINLL